MYGRVEKLLGEEEKRKGVKEMVGEEGMNDCVSASEYIRNFLEGL